MKKFPYHIINNNLNRNIYLRISGHILYWLFVTIFLLILFKWNNQNAKITNIQTAILIPVSAGVVYIFNYFLIPKYLVSKRYFKFFYQSFFTILTSLWLSFLTVLFVLVYVTSKNPPGLNPAFVHPELQIVVMYFIIFFAISIKQVKHAFIIQQEKNELSKIKLTTELKLKDAELKLLKAQIQPHFLFNTLNNLYGLTLEKSNEAPKLVLQLSEILDYILYRCNEKLVPLKEEINNLKNYIEIEKIRYSDKLQLLFDFPNEVKNINIAPLLLIPFVENAFKHGVSNNPGNSKIDIAIEINDSQLTFKICNTKNKIDTNRYELQGIGLKNVQKRLDLIYKGAYNLEIDETVDEYCVFLKLDTEN